MWVWPCTESQGVLVSFADPSSRTYIMPKVTLTHVWYKKQSMLARDEVDKSTVIEHLWLYMYLTTAWEPYQRNG